MGWVSTINAAVARDAKKGQETSTTGKPATAQEVELEQRLLAKAKRLGKEGEARGILMAPYSMRITLTMLDNALSTEEAKQRGEETGVKPTGPQFDPIDAEANRREYERTHQEDPETGQMVRKPEIDAFDDQQFYAQGGPLLNQYALDMNEDVTPHAYRHILLREEGGPLEAQRGPNGELESWGHALMRVHGSHTTGQKYMSRVMQMDEDELEAFQRDLYAAGFYGSVVGQKDQEPIWGAPDEPTKAAVRALTYMTMSFKGKKSITEVLDDFRAQVDKDGDGIPDSEAKDKQKPVVRLTSPTDLAAAAQDQAVDLMGRRLAEGEVGGAIGGYNQLESSFDYGSQMAQIDNTGGTFTAPPTPGSYTEQQLRQTHGAEIDSYTYLQNVNYLLEQLGLG